jgi:hypothetical protein
VDPAVDVAVAMVAVVVVADIAVVATEAAACRVLHPMVAGSAGLMVLQGKGIDRFVGDMDTDGKRVRVVPCGWDMLDECLRVSAPPCTALHRM